MIKLEEEELCDFRAHRSCINNFLYTSINKRHIISFQKEKSHQKYEIKIYRKNELI